MKKSRIGFIDVSKAICILLVIIYHVISPGVIKDIVGCLALPGICYFFIVSGYFANPYKNSTIKNILIRLKQLLIPFVLYSLVLFFLGSLYLMFVKGDSFETCLLCLRNFYLGAIWDKNILNYLGMDYLSLGKRYLFLSAYWFLVQLIIASIIYYLIIKFVDKNNKTLICTIAILALLTFILDYFNIVWIANLQDAPLFVSFLMLGRLFKKIDIFNTKIFNTKPAIMWLAAVVCLGIVISSFWIDKSADLYKGDIGIFDGFSVLILYIRTFAFSYLICAFSKAIQQNHQLKFMNWIGRNTLHYYLTHVFFAWVISITINFDLSYSKDLPDNALLISFLILIGTFILCTIYAYIREKISNKIFSK